MGLLFNGRWWREDGRWKMGDVEGKMGDGRYGRYAIFLTQNNNI